MILANARHQLTREDAQLAIRLVAGDSDDERDLGQQRLADEGIDAILDDPRLPAALLRNHLGTYASLRLFLYVMVRHALVNAGERERSVSDYLAAVLLAFVPKGRAERINETDDQLYDSLVDLLEDVNDRDPKRAFHVRVHLGNRALWMSGLFPDRIEQRKWKRGGPDLGYFEEIGRRGFALAAEHRMARQYGMTDVYAAVAERFGRLRVALNTVSDTVLFPNVHSPERLMRQVSDDARWRLAG